MQLSHVLTLAFATAALAKVYNDNSPISDSVPGPSSAVVMQADVFGTAVGIASAKLRAKTLEARASTIVVCEDMNGGGSCLTITGIENGVCYNINGIWNDSISSTDTHGATCTVFENQGCSGDQSTANGKVNWGHMNDIISSFRCFQ
ncbi:hypothetical protein F5B22DRAFT_660412 [Xylaria bambusicola]|uniref:uncharacterized protein n=1 Tax=Xylaria bambusicola TaxID=326684 RepID=UPI0020073BC6|nr:uncharacterized protein F5B22DRAFT_660412 [Xylaria bambusicola]KAI0506329.1 hypothetical protein F5B22DRAFT_660412 [Xylaria bambusicola]